MLSFSISALLTIHVIVALLIVLLVLMQRPKSEGLGAALGGETMSNLFSANTSNVLATGTRWLGGLFFLLSLILSVLYARLATQRSSIQAAALRHAAVAPAASPANSTNSASLPESAATPAFSGSANLLSTPAASPASGLLPAPRLDGSAPGFR